MAMKLISIYTRHYTDRSGVNGYFERLHQTRWIFPMEISTVDKMGSHQISPSDPGITISLFLVTQKDGVEYIVDAGQLHDIFEAQGKAEMDRYNAS